MSSGQRRSPETLAVNGLGVRPEINWWRLIWRSPALLVSIALILVVVFADIGGASGTGTFAEDGITVTAVQPNGNLRLISESNDEFTKRQDANSGLVIILSKPDHELTVNGKKYGKLERGDKVRIAGDTVSVNGKERPAE